uniref:General secretion pathway protein C n=1 Tax=Ralstonia solanacearum TaxID=305 RepID=A0A097A2S9_RALSL|nr:general secretion pathway protein C [Ralstonia solanacearum]
MTVQQSSRLISLVLFAALCALLAHWVLTLSSLRSLSVPREARVAQTEALETGGAVTGLGDDQQSGPRKVQVAGVVNVIINDNGAAIVSIDGDQPQAIRAGKALSPSLKLAEIKARAVVIERNGVRQEIALPASAVAGVWRAALNAPTRRPPSGAAAPMATPAIPPPPPSAMVGNPANTAMPGAALPLTPAPPNINDAQNAPQIGITGPRHRGAAAARKGVGPDDGVDH